jgi:hypothetical protein
LFAGRELTSPHASQRCQAKGAEGVCYVPDVLAPKFWAVDTVKEQWRRALAVCEVDELPFHDRRYASFVMLLIGHDGVLNYLVDRGCESHAAFGIEFIKPQTHLREGDGAYTLVGSIYREEQPINLCVCSCNAPVRVHAGIDVRKVEGGKHASQPVVADVSNVAGVLVQPGNV